MAATKTPTPWAAVAAAVRREVKARRAELGIPAGAVVRVTSEGFSGGASVDVRITGADEWAWKTADDRDAREWRGAQPGMRITSSAARAVGDAIAEVIRVERDKTEAGYIWGGVSYGLGTMIGSLAQKGFVPGQD